MRFETRPLGDYFDFQKGLGYLGKYLQTSDVALIGLNSFDGKGGYKNGSEKEYSGPFRAEHLALPGDLFVATTDITQDGRVLASPLKMPDLSKKYKKVIFSGDIVKAAVLKDGASSDFLYNVLRVRKYRDKAAYASTGSTVRRIPISALRNLEIPIPSTSQQTQIVSLISAFDRKIDLNQEMASTCEDLAQTIFKSWFIDFDPVHAKARGEQPVGMDEKTAALFPDSFEDSELGLLPNGWRTSRLGNLVGLVGERATVGVDTLAAPYVPIDQIDSRSIFLKNWLSGEEAKTSLVSFQQGDVLFGAMRPYFHKVCLAPFAGTTRSTVFVLRPREPRLQMFSLMQMFAESTIEFATNNSSGSTIPYATWKGVIEDVRVVVPPHPLLDKFQELTESLVKAGYGFLKENEALSRLRDELLPRLITGELEIPEELLGDDV